MNNRDTKEIYHTTLAIRNFEIDLFWKRSNYFLVLNTSIAFGFFSVDPVYKLGISILGFLICCLWFAVTLGGKYWQSRWEQQLTNLEKELALNHKMFTATREELYDLVKSSLDFNSHPWYRKPFDRLVLARFSVSFMMTLLSLIFIVFWLFLFFNNLKIGEIKLLQPIIANNSNPPENIYWLFSASAQSISAFLALLLTGFAIVISIMTTMEQRDETLSELLHTLKVRYYKMMITLAIITGCAIVLSLYSVYMNGKEIWFNNYLYTITSIFDVLAIAGSIAFMLYVINPNKYKNLANKLYEQEKKNISSQGQDVEGIEFLQSFIQLEKLVRQIVEGKETYIDRQYLRREILSFRNMIEILLKNKLINGSLFERLLEISKIRNLVVHGKIDKVDKGLVEYTQQAINEIYSKYNPRTNGDHDEVEV